jgi:hypothetical protein
MAAHIPIYNHIVCVCAGTAGQKIKSVSLIVWRRGLGANKVLLTSLIPSSRRCLRLPVLRPWLRHAISELTRCPPANLLMSSTKACLLFATYNFPPICSQYNLLVLILNKQGKFMFGSMPCSCILVHTSPLVKEVKSYCKYSHISLIRISLLLRNLDAFIQCRLPR